MSGLGETNAVRTFRVGSRELTAPILEEILFRGFLAEPVVGKIAEETVILSSLGSRDYSHRLCQVKLTLRRRDDRTFKAPGGRVQSDLNVRTYEVTYPFSEPLALSERSRLWGAPGSAGLSFR